MENSENNYQYDQRMSAYEWLFIVFSVAIMVFMLTRFSDDMRYERYQAELDKTAYCAQPGHNETLCQK